MLPKTAKDTKDSQSRLDFFLMLEQNLMLPLDVLTSTQKGKESLMVQFILKIVILFSLLLNCLLLSMQLECFQ